MLPLLIDENLNHRIVRGLKRRLPQVNYILAQNAGLKGVEDPVILASAAEHGRVLVTHDVNTVPGYAYDRCVAGLSVPGVIAIPKSLPIGQAIDELVMVLECAEPRDLEGLVIHLPL